MQRTLKLSEAMVTGSGAHSGESHTAGMGAEGARCRAMYAALNLSGKRTERATFVAALILYGLQSCVSA